MITNTAVSQKKFIFSATSKYYLLCISVLQTGSLDSSLRVADIRPVELGRFMSHHHIHHKTPGEVDIPHTSVSMKGIVILSLCAVYTVVLFSCVAVVKALAVLLMGQPLTINAIDFKKKQHELESYDSNFNLFGEAPCSRCSSISGRN